MKGIIIYFSLTGNTKKIAKAIHQGMSHLMEPCDIATTKEVDVQRLGDYDLIGLGFPDWGHALPLPIQHVIDAMARLKGQYVFTFFTHGTLPEWGYQVLNALQKKELAVIGIRHWYGSVNLPRIPKPFLTDGHPDSIDLKEAESFGEEMAGLRQRISREGPKIIPPLPPIPEQPSRPPAVIGDNPPKLNIEKCRYPECQLCMDHCPMNGIDLSVSPPVFAKPCRSCNFCEMICPEGAIETDYDSLVEPTLKRMKEVYVPHLNQAEAEGRFRRLVPVEAIGWDTPFYKIHNQHPRYVIPED